MSPFSFQIYELFESRTLLFPCSDHSEIMKAQFLPFICLQSSGVDTGHGGSIAP